MNVKPTYCSNCERVCNLGGVGNSILVDFPFGHPLDTVETFVFFCSSECLMAYIEEKQFKLKGGE